MPSSKRIARGPQKLLDQYGYFLSVKHGPDQSYTKDRTLSSIWFSQLADVGVKCNKGEARQALAKAVVAAITFRNTIYMDRAASHPAQTSPLHDAKLLPHTSPLWWEHIILSGDFDWHSGAAVRKIARPLNIRPARDWGI